MEETSPKRSCYHAKACGSAWYDDSLAIDDASGRVVCIRQHPPMDEIHPDLIGMVEYHGARYATRLKSLARRDQRLHRDQTFISLIPHKGTMVSVVRPKRHSRTL